MSQTFNFWRAVEEKLRSTHCRSRIKWSQCVEPGKWTHFFIVPTDGYIEGRLGPIPVREVDWVEIDPIALQDVGRLIPQRQIDHTAAWMSYLAQQGIRFQRVESGFRIYNDAME
jgi:hypothetical protein